jgi:S1-C subfamily serine protease
MSALTSLSEDLGTAVASAARSVVAVAGEQRRPRSGTIWRPGVVVTAEHALERDDVIEVIAPDGTKCAAKLAGSDATTDLAVLTIGAAIGAPAAPAAAGEAKVGHLVLAVGRTGDDGPSASMGVLSAVGGPWTTWRGGRVDSFLRADLTLYPGFSGGPLVDASGRVIGINTSGLSRHWSLTLPPATVDRVVTALLARGRVAHGYLGVGLQSVRIPEAVRRSLDLPSGGGAIVVAVEQGSPAESGGIMIGDVLLALDGAPVTDVEDLHGLLGPDRIGSAVPVEVIRAGARASVRVTIGERHTDDDE